MARSEGGPKGPSGGPPNGAQSGARLGPQIGGQMGRETGFILEPNLGPPEGSIFEIFSIWDVFTTTLQEERARNRKWPDLEGLRKGLPRGPKGSPIGSPKGSPDRSPNRRPKRVKSEPNQGRKHPSYPGSCVRPHSQIGYRYIYIYIYI